MKRAWVLGATFALGAWGWGGALPLPKVTLQGGAAVGATSATAGAPVPSVCAHTRRATVCPGVSPVRV